jgi:MFS family permease
VAAGDAARTVAERTNGPVDRAQARGILIVLASIALLVQYVETMVIPALGKFREFYDNAPFSTLAWILSAYLLVGVVATPICGKLGDVYGKKRVLTLIVGVYAVAVAVAGFSPELGQAMGLDRPGQLYLFIGLRGVQGVGMGMFPVAFSIIAEVFPPNEVGPAQGIISAMFGGGAAIGLVGGAYLTQSFGWQFTYHTVIPVAFVTLALIFLVLKESKVRLDRPVDMPGAAALGLALGWLLLGLNQGPVWGWGNTHGTTVGGIPLGTPQFLALAVGCAALFAAREYLTRYPIVDFARLSERNILLSNLNGILVSVAMFVMFVAGTYLIEMPGDGLNQPVLAVGLLSLPASVLMLFVAPQIGKLVGRRGPKPVMAFGFASVAVGGVLLSVFNRNVYELAIIPIPFFVGMVSVMISMTNIILLSSDPRETGIQTGMNSTFRNLGAALGPIVATTILSSFLVAYQPFGPLGPSVPLPSLRGFQVAYLVVAGIGVAGAIVSLGLRNFRFLADGSLAPDRPSPSPPAVAARGRA